MDGPAMLFGAVSLLSTNIARRCSLPPGTFTKAPPKFARCVEQVEAGEKNSSCLPDRVYQEAVLALDLATGNINWVRRLDGWNAACSGPGNNNDNCPAAPGPDADFGMAPAFISASTAKTPHGQDTLVVGQKSGALYAISAVDGTVFWATQTSPGSYGGGLSYGLAVDSSRVYFTAINYNQETWNLQPSGRRIHNSAWSAASLVDGTLLWQKQVPGDDSWSISQPTVTNDVVICGRTLLNLSDASVGGGELVMLDASNGHILSAMPLDTPFFGGNVVQDEYLMFGTGYFQDTEIGSLYVVRVA
jgi:outer membrane protein assembly factor BamB